LAAEFPAREQPGSLEALLLDKDYWARWGAGPDCPVLLASGSLAHGLEPGPQQSYDRVKA